MLVLRFELGDLPFALEARDVVEVVPQVDVRALPRAPAWLKGLMLYRGRPVPLLDLGALVSGQPARNAHSSRAIIVHVDGPAPPDGPVARVQIGLLADRVTDVETVPDAAIVASPIVLLDAPFLGPVIALSAGRGLTHLVRPGALMTPDMLAALFPAAVLPAEGP